MIVADSSATLALVAPDEVASQSIEEAMFIHPLVVPAHWGGEIANALWVMQRRKRISAKDVEEITRQLAGLVLEQDVQPPEHWWFRVLPLAVEHNLTAYDAAFLELARRRGLPLATLDQALRKAASDAGVDLL